VPAPASKGKRLTAALVDVLIAFLLMQLLLRSRTLGAFRWRAFLLFCIPAAYMVIRDSFAGKSIGKFLLGLTTYNLRDRKPADFADSVLRNWFFFVLLLPPYIGFFRFVVNPGMLIFALLSLVVATQIVSGNGRRIGDGQANTLVVEDRALREL
jgi:hypothetical protein